MIFILGTWKYVSVVYCKNMEDKYNGCEKCLDFIATNPDNLFEKLEKIEKNVTTPSKTMKYPEDLKTLCKYLLFCAPAVPLPISGNMVTKVQKG